MAARQQVRLLLWKDYLIRKRNWITLLGIVWATAIISSLYIVRANIKNEDFPTCQFQARALPSAGLLTFLQSFICNINNECSSMDQYQEIPTYEKSRFTELQRRFTPLLYNESILDVATSVPDALKLISTLADVVDQPTFVNITKNGLKVEDLFRNPSRLSRFLSKRLSLPNDVTHSLMTSQLSLQGIFKGSVDRCSAKSIAETILLKNPEHLKLLSEKLCDLSDEDAQKFMFDVLLQLDFSKFIKMIGDMYSKLSGDRRLSVLGDTITAVLRMMSWQSFVPKELYVILKGETGDFTYFDLELIPKFLDLFKPTFGDTDSYKDIREFADTAVKGLQYLHQFTGQNANTQYIVEEVASVGPNVASNVGNTLNKAIDVIKNALTNQSSLEVFDVLSKVTSFIYKWLPKPVQEDVLFYSTLLAKFFESASDVIKINYNLEEIAERASLRHSDGVKILTALPKEIIAKGFDALADTERIQIFTSKVNTPEKIFCDVNRIQEFFKVSKGEASSLQKQLCVNSFNAYIADLITSFGVYDVKDSINSMASLLIQKTVGRDTKDLLYTIDKDFKILSNFTQTLLQMTIGNKTIVDWQRSLNISEDSEFMKVARDKSKMATQTLINIHGTLAKEIVTQNTILTYKISPILIDATFLLQAINDQLDLTPKDLITRFKSQYPDIIETFLLTLLDENKTYKSLSTHNEDIFCKGVDNAAKYIIFKDGADVAEMVQVLCDTSSNIERVLDGNSTLSKAMQTLATEKRKEKNINWNLLINNLKSLNSKLDKDFPYLFRYKSFGMERKRAQHIEEMMENATEMWFGKNHFDRGVRLSLKLIFQLLEFMDHGIFDIKYDFWIQLKYVVQSLTGYLTIFDDTLQLVVGISTNTSIVSTMPNNTVEALQDILPNTPQLIVDAADIVTRDDIDIAPIISLLNSPPTWPCGDVSISHVLPLRAASRAAARALESMLCADHKFQLQWTGYLQQKKFNQFNWHKWNTTVFERHIFLKFSSNFDTLLNDTIQFKDVLLSTFNQTSDSELNVAKALKYALGVLNTTDSPVTLRKFFTKADTIINAVNTSTPLDTPVSQLWERLLNCSSEADTPAQCHQLTRSTWKHTLQFISVLFKNLAEDLLTYFNETNEPTANLLQMLGFTRSTGLYILYDKFPDFLSVLINSYMDIGFMSQVRRATESQFWDCEAVVRALVPPPGSSIDAATIKKVQPFICPSIFHWISLPRGDNIILDVFNKPQYFFYTLPAENLTSEYAQAYNKTTGLADYITDIAKQNKSLSPIPKLSLKILEEKLKQTIDSIMTFKVDLNDTSYIQFYKTYTKEAITHIYLARVVAITDKIANALNSFNINGLNVSEIEKKHLESEVSILKKAFVRRPSEVLAMHFDIITHMLWKNDDKFDLFSAFDIFCKDLKNNVTDKDILQDIQRSKIQFCAKNISFIYGNVEKAVENDYAEASKSLKNLVKMLDNAGGTDKDIAEILKPRKQLIDSYRKSIAYAYDLSIPIYIQYLQSNIRHYSVILSVLSSSDWWSDLRTMYNGHQAHIFFDTMEQSFEIAEDVIGNLDRIHIVRLLRDINTNNTVAFCQPNVTLSDYVPDGTGKLSELKKRMCDAKQTEIFEEIVPLKFAAQGYDNELRINDVINYTSLNADVNGLQVKLEALGDGPKQIKRPLWINDQKISQLTKVAARLLSKESLIRTSFGILSNVVDAATLYLNNSQCTLCSQLTSWLKQINLQLYKKQEYDHLLCYMELMPQEELHQTLKNDFHWDMAIQELVRTRNYTKFELNKSLNEFLELVKLHVLEAAGGRVPRLASCLASDVGNTTLGNVTLFIRVLSHTTRLLMSELSHLQEIDGIQQVPFFMSMEAQIAHNLDVFSPLQLYVKDQRGFHEDLKTLVNDSEIAADIENCTVNLKLVSGEYQINHYATLEVFTWEDVCQIFDCHRVGDVIVKHLDLVKVDKDRRKLQSDEFWRFEFISRILSHAALVLRDAARLVGGASRADVTQLGEGSASAILDLVVQLVNDDVLKNILHSLHGLIAEFHPVLSNTSLEFDLRALADGLAVINDFKHYLLDNFDLKLKVSSIFSNPDRIESELNSLGINNTNFWSIAAPRIQLGYLNLKPLLTEQKNFHIADYVCQIDKVCTVVVGGGLDVVTSEEVCEAVVGQYCALGPAAPAQLLPVLLTNLNFTYVFEKVSQVLLTQLYSASNLTEVEGAGVLESFPKMAALLPVVQSNVGDLASKLSREPLLESFKNFESIGGLLSSAEFLSRAGSMLCGVPFRGSDTRFYSAVAAAQDFNDQPDPRQLDLLPSEYCRSMYRDVLKMPGGKIVWSFVKPLIMGKILYTPSTGYVHRIVEQANATFAHMQRLANIVHSFANSFSSVDKLSQHKQGIEVLKRLMTSNEFTDIRSMLVGGGDIDFNFEVDGLFDDYGDVKNVGGLLSRASNLLSCVNLDRFTPVDDEKTLAHEAVQLTAVNEFSAGLVFLNVTQNEELPSNVEYKIRMDIESVPTTSRLRNQFWIPGPESSFLENMRYFRGFVQIQDLVDRAIIQLATSSRRKRQTDVKEQSGSRIEDYAVYTQQMPYPCYRKDSFQTSLYESQALVVAFFFSLLFSVASAVRFIVSEKENGNTMLLSVMGVDPKYVTLSWFLATYAEILVTCVCITIALYAGGILPHTNPVLIFALLMIFGFSVIMFCYMLSKLVRSASLGAVCAALAYLVTFMPYVLILSLEALLSHQAKLCACLSMSTAFSYAILYIARYEAVGVGVGWQQLWVSPDKEDRMSIGAAACLMILDGLIYLAIGCIIERFYGYRSVSSNITHATPSGGVEGVSISHVSKHYSGHKMALQDVSVELRRGQLTTLLGHNGAGKTTLINILTGMCRPTSGQVSVSDGPARVGVCPQHDVLYERLTPREHVALYAALQLPADQVQQEVDSMMRLLNLGVQGAACVRQLSGGVRRRLCTALACCGRAPLVALDEPGAGVDPHHRREIWSLIMKLKQDRTILLTTHHLDEAELLSDQVVILHKGHVHTSGTTLEIKRSLGDGYKLTVTYPKPTIDYHDTSIEEKTKLLLSMVREVVKNAQLSEQYDCRVEISLPFYDADGVDSDYLTLCETLERSQAVLGYSHMSMECSSLEQVFFKTCAQADAAGGAYGTTSSDSSLESVKKSIDSEEDLVTCDDVTPTHCQHLIALLKAKFLHYSRNAWLLFLLLVLPSLFVLISMSFSMIRPPPDNEVALRLHPDLYQHTTSFLVKKPTIYSEGIDPTFAENVMRSLALGSESSRNWTSQDSPNCTCTATRQVCDASTDVDNPKMMLLSDVDTLNKWLIASHDNYIEKRYGGFTSSILNNKTYLISWYNNKGHHSMPSFLNAVNSAILRTVTDNSGANITTYSHPLKISSEQLSRSSLYQHVADAGISCMLLVAASLVSAGAVLHSAAQRTSAQRHLHLLCGVQPWLYHAMDLLTDMMVMLLNILITVCVLESFGFPVFVARNNLPAICLLLALFGYACSNFVHIMERRFSEPSLANMILFCANVFIGLAGITILLILDIISDSESTDAARRRLHKVFLCFPQFALADGLLEIAKNTVQAQVLERFGMDTYKDPLASELLRLHYLSLVVVGTVLLLVNLALEYDCGEIIMKRLCKPYMPPAVCASEPEDVAAERVRVKEEMAQAQAGVLRLPTIGNINAGFVEAGEIKSRTMNGGVSLTADVAACVELSKVYRGAANTPPAVDRLTLGIPRGQCVALLGENGAGKSSLFGVFAGRAAPAAGAVLLDGRVVSRRQLLRGGVGYCPQNNALDPLLTVTETLQLYCSLRGIAHPEHVIARTLARFELSGHRAARAHSLSGGTRRKLCAALAFTGPATLVLLDEPTTGMDPGGRGVVGRAARGGRGRGVLLCTHALQDAVLLADRVALLHAGRLRAIGTVDDCIARFGGGYVARVSCSRPGHVLPHVRALPAVRVLAVLTRALHVLLPARATVEGKEVVYRTSDVFRLMSQLQASRLVDDYTINLSSLDQMFLNETDELSSLERDVSPTEPQRHRSDTHITSL